MRTIRRSSRNTCGARRRARRPRPIDRRFRGVAERSLFDDSGADASDSIVLASGDADVRLLRGWLAPARADALLAWIHANAAWGRERRTMYDRVVDVPREQAWFGEGGLVAPGGELDAIRRELETTCGARFAFVLANRYRNGSDSVAWHSDRETDGIAAPVIASLTLGATRAFDLRRKTDRARITSVDLDHGDLVIMAGDTQRTYEHRVAKDPRIAGERINLTFRQRHEARGANHA